MCGISGFFSVQNVAAEFYITCIQKMMQTIAHRGPDDGDYWVDTELHLAFGHRRLSVIDLNPTGHQPMHSPEGRFIMVYNGEIYNYLDLKKELDQFVRTNWRGHSDTEVILKGFEYWGIKNTLAKMNGMFAFAVFDKRDRQLILARDRMGEKPLYYGWLNDFFVFGSELKIMKGLGIEMPQVDTAALNAYFRYGYIPAPATIFKGFKKLLPSGYIEISLESLRQKIIPEVKFYWSAKDYFLNQHKSMRTVEELEKALENILDLVVAQTLISDVPVGAFLSGGVDSSLITALMQKNSASRVKTFTIGFTDAKFNEAEYALAVAKHLGTDHTEYYLSQNELLAIIPKLAKIYDEPFADSSQIPTHLISVLAQSKVKVALSGDGGDELFAGYTRYQMAKSLLDVKNYLPNILTQGIANIVLSLPNFANNNGLLKKIGIARLWDLSCKAAAILKLPADQIYESLIALWKLNEKVVLGKQWTQTLQNTYNLEDSSNIARMMYTDMMTYLPDDIMVKVDRAAMAVGLETRAPFLDRRFVEFACGLPISMKLNGKTTKHILKNVLYKYVPRQLIDRPKQGFGVPLADWLQTSLREWSGDLLSYEQLAKHDLLDADLIAKKWQYHLTGQENNAFPLWAVLMFQSWYNEYMG